MIKPIEQEASIWRTDWPVAAPKEPFTTEVFNGYMSNSPWNFSSYWWRCRVGWSGLHVLDTHEKYRTQLTQTTFGIVLKNRSYKSEQVSCRLRMFFTNDKGQEGQQVGSDVSGGTQSIGGNSTRRYTLNCYKLNFQEFSPVQKWNYLGFEIAINPTYCGTLGLEYFNLTLSIMK